MVSKLSGAWIFQTDFNLTEPASCVFVSLVLVEKLCWILADLTMLHRDIYLSMYYTDKEGNLDFRPVQYKHFKPELFSQT